MSIRTLSLCLLIGLTPLFSGCGGCGRPPAITMPSVSASSAASKAMAKYDANSDGKIEFLGLHRGLYNVIARNGDEVGAIDFELEESVDLGTLELKDSVAIRGHIFDAQGQPLAGATVDAARMAEGKSFNMTRTPTGRAGV